MESFQELGLPAFLGDSLKRMNFVKPTPVQAQAIPAALLGKDVIASAQTGTGKTGAFGIPLLNFLFNNPTQTALILTPTRELAVQVLEVLRKLTGTHFMGGSVLLIGGANMGTQLSALARKPRLFIGTPGRVIDHLQRGSLNLSNAGFLVLDEADRMLDMGFAPQLEEIRKRLPVKRQTLLFSATIPSNIQSMGSRFLKDPIRITVGETSQPISKIAQMVIHTVEARKPDELVSELNTRQGSVLIFARTQSRVDRIAERLKEQGFKVTRIHGGRSQSQRKQAIDHFREGHYRVLVATDIAARGLDIHHIAHVINYDLPRNPEDYIHRVGRTARAGAEGNSLCFLTSEDRGLWDRILKLIKAPKDSIQVKGTPMGGPPSRGPQPHRGSHKPSHPGAHGKPSFGSTHRPQGDRPSGAPHQERKPFAPHQARPSGDRPHKPFEKNSNFSRNPQDRPQERHGRPPHREGSGFAKAAPDRSQDRPAFTPSRSFDENRGNHGRPHDGARPSHPFKREGAPHEGWDGFQKRRHPDGRHQKRSTAHAERQGFGGKDSQGSNLIFHGKEPNQAPPQRDDDQQPMDNRSSWGSKSLGGSQGTPFAPRTNRPQRPGGFRGGADTRSFRPGVMSSGSGEGSFRPERRPGGGDRPHRSGPGGPGGRPGGFRKDSRPGGGFKKSGFRPKPH